ncbi:alpha/beta fold hydrolase [Corynebacterium genitalium ATCC 33030]|uniref:AB hydrolase-1 domain-containing protein n=1 Tax=Corynebacterium genitalium ATCC 33030 TaxID=585529 RepID=D7W956_9CORY|nr:alpha/beta fold hydrolase [Corynebacterium genitalium]EFK55336.1 hypothetical protein HMPREF0291_10594 [Corynebacterium genitalium ATCC 33030]UUA89414.1 alpha/beta fold hydrolase [Corynebacterium genitalium ATCC 33030]
MSIRDEVEGVFDDVIEDIHPEIFNDPDFLPRHDTPVLYVHGIHSRASAFRRQGKFLRDNGYWVWSFDYGKMRLPGLYGVGPFLDLVAELSDNIDTVLEATGAKQVDLIAHSQGGNVAAHYVSNNRHEEHIKVRRVVTMGTPFYGTDFSGWVPRVPWWIINLLGGPGAKEQLQGVNAPVTDQRVVYTSLYSRADTWATPHSSSFLTSDNGADVAVKAIPSGPKHPLMPRDMEIAELTKWGLEREAQQSRPR